MPEIKGDYQGRLKTITCTEDAKLETVSAIDAGTNVIGNIDRVATVGQIDHLGSIANTEFDIGRVGTIADIEHLGSIGNVSFNQGAVSEHRRDLYTYNAGTWAPVHGTANRAYTLPHMYYNTTPLPLMSNMQNQLVVAPGYTGSVFGPLLTDSEYRLKLATLGTVERVKEINHLGTVGKSQTYIEQDGTWSALQGTVHGAYTVPKAERAGTVYNLRANRDRDLVTAPGWTGSRRVKLLTDDDWQLKTAPARSRKGVVQTVANAGTAVALVASSTPVIGVIVKAQHENLGTIYVGDSTVDDTHGFLLRRDEFISFSCQNAGSVFIDASRNAQKVSALYINY